MRPPRRRPARQGGRRPAGHPAGRRPGRAAAARRWCSPAAASAPPCWPSSPPRPPGTRSTGGAWTSGGATSGSSPPGDPERNETGARQALLDHVDVDPARVRADARHRRTRRRRPGGGGRPVRGLAGRRPPGRRTTVRCRRSTSLLLGIGPDGHVASLFPGMPALYDERPVVAVRGAPKPPPTRLSLTLPAIQAAREVWIVCSGRTRRRRSRLALSDVRPGAGARRRGARQAADAIPARQRRGGEGAGADRPPGRPLTCPPACARRPGLRPGKWRVWRRARTGS